jgi:hypothetical protein
MIRVGSKHRNNEELKQLIESLESESEIENLKKMSLGEPLLENEILTKGQELAEYRSKLSDAE